MITRRFNKLKQSYSLFPSVRGDFSWWRDGWQKLLSDVTAATWRRLSSLVSSLSSRLPSLVSARLLARAPSRLVWRSFLRVAYELVYELSLSLWMKPMLTRRATARALVSSLLISSKVCPLSSRLVSRLAGEGWRRVNKWRRHRPLFQNCLTFCMTPRSALFWSRSAT